MPSFPWRKDKDKKKDQEEYAPPPGPPPAYAQSSKNATDNYAPPPGPPPSHHAAAADNYQPPPGPPPSHIVVGNDEYAPPLGPPPSHTAQQPQEPLPKHDWTVIPDNSLLPPPPSIGYDSSPTANATIDEGNWADAWTKANPLYSPGALNPAQHQAIQNNQLVLQKPQNYPGFVGDLLSQRRPGHWKCRTHANCKDTCLTTTLPLYSEVWDSPLRTKRPKTIYFELKVLGVGRGESTFSEADSGIAIGFIAPPYPPFRLPGWQRGSLGVHGDDGRKYVNDTWGGNDFTYAFVPGDTVGIGMTFAPPRNPPGYEETQQGKVLDISVFFTRNGRREGGWDGNEELDAKCEGGTIGLRGECDLFPAVGVFGGVDFEVFFSPEDWRFNPY